MTKIYQAAGGAPGAGGFPGGAGTPGQDSGPDVNQVDWFNCLYILQKYFYYHKILILNYF